ncbi:MAG: lipoyl(octanoyl) transferase LipB [Pelagibacterales bacterium]|nr:lipoyl(octanoyl) transferase LipB [Pelagibacterales bacterium]
MKIEIKKSTKPVEYKAAIDFLEKRLLQINQKKETELIWILEHPSTYTAGTRYNENEILDKSINVIKTNRGGKITYHGPGQTIFYFIIDLTKRKKDIRKFTTTIENTIIQTLKEYQINSFSDRDNIGIWVNHKNKIKKIAAIGIRVSKWIAYHGFAINVNNNIENYNKIIPCGIKDKDVSNLKLIKDQNYDELSDKIINNFIKNLET